MHARELIKLEEREGPSSKTADALRPDRQCGQMGPSSLHREVSRIAQIWSLCCQPAGMEWMGRDESGVIVVKPSLIPTEINPPLFCSDRPPFSSVLLSAQSNEKGNRIPAKSSSFSLMN